MNKVLITGATGFIGSHLTEFLIKQNFNVVAFDRYNSNNNWGWLEESKFKNDFNIIDQIIKFYLLGFSRHHHHHKLFIYKVCVRELADDLVRKMHSKPRWRRGKRICCNISIAHVYILSSVGILTIDILSVDLDGPFLRTVS